MEEEKMEDFEKVEKLSQKAKVSMEDARAALEANNWDLLDAMIDLERQGKTASRGQEAFSTSYEDQNQYEKVADSVEKEEDEGKKRNYGRNMGRMFRNFVDAILHSNFQMNRNEKKILSVPSLLLVVAMLFFWKILLILMVVSLFFNCRYSFEGHEHLEEVNDAIQKAGDMADRMKQEFNRED